MSRKLLYYREVDDSIGTYVTDYLVGGILLITAIVLVIVYKKTRRGYQDGESPKSEKHDGMNMDSREDMDNFPSNSRSLDTAATSSLGKGLVHGTLTTVLLLFSFSFMFLAGGAVHDRVPHINVSSGGGGGQQRLADVYRSNITARDAVLPYHALWTLASVGGGLIAGAFVVLAYHAARTDLQLMTLHEQQRPRAATDTSMVGLLQVDTWRRVSLRHMCTRHPMATKGLFYGAAAAIAVSNAALQTMYLVTYVMDTDTDRWIYARLKELGVDAGDGFKILDWKSLWRILIASILLESANLLCALILTYLLLTSGNLPGSGRLMRNARVLQCCAVWTLFVGGMLQIALAQCTHHDDDDDGIVTSRPSCAFPREFNHNAIYHLVTGAGAVILAVAHVKMEVAGSRLAAEHRLRHRSLRHDLMESLVA